MSVEEQSIIIDLNDFGTVQSFLVSNFVPQSGANVRKALFDPSIRALVPNAKFWSLTGEVTIAIGWLSYWQLQALDEENGGGQVGFITMPGGNHFVCLPSMV